MPLRLKHIVGGTLGRTGGCSIVSIQKWLFSPISLLGGNFNPRNINPMPAVKISARLKLDENISFLDGHSIAQAMRYVKCDIASPAIRNECLHGVIGIEIGIGLDIDRR
jgi:hypothetical protein